MKKKKWLIGISTLFILMLIAIWVCNSIVKNTATARTFDDSNKVPSTHVAVLLGTSKLLASGQENLYFKYRIDACVSLFKSGKINYIIVSGDNGNKGYNEPEDMKDALVSSGIPASKIYLDYAGFSTLDSMCRVKNIFNQSRVIIVSQQFHNERAVYLALNHGIDAYGFNAQNVSAYYGIKTNLREKLARVKAVMDVIIGTKPKFDGEVIAIPT